MGNVFLALHIIVAIIALQAIAPLWSVSILVRSRKLRQAWQALTAVVIGCVSLLTVHAVASYGQPLDIADLAKAGIFLLGASFVYAVALLSKCTAIHTLRVEDLAKAAFADALTGIGNLRRFSDALSAAIADAKQHGFPLSVIVLDIDHFKQINDSYGHAAGDEVIKQIAAALVVNVRASDTVCRIGGEEFAIIVPLLQPDHAMALAERIRTAVAALRIEVGAGNPLLATVSVGCASLAAHETSADLLLRADSALYAAKQSGRDCVRLAA